jgi:hypothetical protein
VKIAERGCLRPSMLVRLLFHMFSFIRYLVRTALSQTGNIFKKINLFKIKIKKRRKRLKYLKNICPIERYDSHPKLEGSSNLVSLSSEIQLRRYKILATLIITVIP